MSIEKIQQLIEFQNFHKAKEFTKNFLSENPKSSLALSYLSKCEIELGNLERAETILNESLSIDPNNRYALLVQLSLFYSQKKYRKVISTGKGELERDPENSYIHSVLAAAFFNIRNFELSEKHINKSLELDPSNESSLLLKAQIKYVFEQDFNANKLIKESLEINPENYDLYIVLGDRELNGHQYSIAKDYFQRALSINPLSEQAQQGFLTAIKGEFSPWLYNFFQKNAYGYFKHSKRSEKSEDFLSILISLTILPYIFLIQYYKWYTYVVYDLFFFLNKNKRPLFDKNEKKRIYFFLIWHLCLIIFLSFAGNFHFTPIDKCHLIFLCFFMPISCLAIFDLTSKKHIYISLFTLLLLNLIPLLISGNSEFITVYSHSITAALFFFFWRSKFFLMFN